MALAAQPHLKLLLFLIMLVASPLQAVQPKAQEKSSLPDYALETVAVWLGVSVEDRHRALSDARITAEVFVKIVPMLDMSAVLPRSASNSM